LIVVVATVGCSKALDYFREKHPPPPAGAFPPRVGKMVLEDRAPDKDTNCTRADPLHCWAYYVLPGGDDELTRIHYYFQIYDSPEEAKERLESYAREQGFRENIITWEDGGQKIGRLLIKNTVFKDGDAMFGYCSASYTKDSWAITIFHGYECEPAKQFVKDLVAD
jgi:hypothetical protein